MKLHKWKNLTSIEYGLSRQQCLRCGIRRTLEIDRSNRYWIYHVNITYDLYGKPVTSVVDIYYRPNCQPIYNAEWNGREWVINE